MISPLPNDCHLARKDCTAIDNKFPLKESTTVTTLEKPYCLQQEPKSTFFPSFNQEQKKKRQVSSKMWHDFQKESRNT